MKRLLFVFIATLLLSQTYSSWLIDRAGLIKDPAMRARIEGLILEIERKTGCEIAVFTERKLSENEYLEEYVNKLFEKLGVGKKDKDNGLLIYVARDSRLVRIEVGYGLEPIITDGIAGEIIDKAIVPYFRQGRYGLGLYMAVNKVADRLEKAYGIKISRDKFYYQQSRPEQRKGSALFSLIVFIIIFLLLSRSGLGWLPLLLFFGGGPRGGFGGGFGSGFGGFGGGLSGGGGASGSW